MITNLKKRATALAVVAVASLVAAAGIAAAPAEAAGNINFDKQGSITVHKYETPAGGAGRDGGNGTAASAPAGATPLQGAKFTVHKVEGIDLRVAADWAKVQQLRFDGSAVTAPSGARLGAQQGTEMTTPANGVVTFSNLPVGVYLVQETEAPSKVTKKASPFFVTVPYPTPADNPALAGAENGWIYDVHVFPKNDTSTVTKTVGDTTATTKEGSEIEWNIGATVPTGADLTGFRVHDTLDSKLKYSATNAAVVKVGNTPLAQGVDFDLVKTDAAGAKIEFNFKQAGLDKLNQHKGQQVTVKFFTTVVGPIADNVIPNEGAKVGFNNNPGGGGDWNEVPPTTTPKAFFGEYKIKKVSKTDKAPLKGAKFGIFASQEAAANPENAIQTVTSNEQGIIEFTDLYRGKEDVDTKTYYVKEIEAPAGFKLDDSVREVQVTKTSGNQADQGTEIQNTPYTAGDLPSLPMTGASGQILMTLGGIAVISAAAGTVLVTRRKKED